MLRPIVIMVQLKARLGSLYPPMFETIAAVADSNGLMRRVVRGLKASLYVFYL